VGFRVTIGDGGAAKGDVDGPRHRLAVHPSTGRLEFFIKSDRGGAAEDLLWAAEIRQVPRYGRAGVPGLELAWRAHDDEALYGLGERFDGLNQAGKSVEMWIRDAPGGGVNLADSYFCTPVLFSSRGYALFATDNPEGSFDLNAGHDGWCRYRRAGTKLTFYIIGGDNLRSLVEARGRIVGPFRGVPDWAWGPWVSRNSFETQAEAEAVLAEMTQRNLPVAAIVQEAWKGRSESGDFNNVSPQRWPDFSGYLAACADGHVCNILWQTPILHPTSPHFAAARERHFLVCDAHGKVRLRRNWLAGFANIDFTNPQAVGWWQDQMRDELRAGVCGFKADDGEDIAATDTFFDGRRGWQMHNLYSTLYNRALIALLDDASVDGMIWARSGSLGIEQAPALWAGDQYATWPQLRSLVPAGLSTSISGMPFWGHDIGGYLGTPSPELYIRWLQFGAFSPLMQYHGVTPREPWAFGPEAELAYARLAHLRAALAPTLKALGAAAARAGTPIMQPMIYAFPDDARFIGEDTQYMLGPDLLVAPVLEEGAYGRRVLFPAGRWRQTLKPVAFTGPAAYDVAIDVQSVPVFVRDGADLAINPDQLRQVPPGIRPHELTPEPILQNVNVPLMGNAFTGSAPATFECDPEHASDITIRVSRLGESQLTQAITPEWNGATCRFSIETHPGPDLLGAAQHYAIELQTAPTERRTLYDGTIRWLEPATLALSTETTSASADRQIHAEMVNRTSAPVPVDLTLTLPNDAQAEHIVLAPYERKDIVRKISLPDRTAVVSRSISAELHCSGKRISHETAFVAPGWRWVVVGPFPAYDRAAFRMAFSPEWTTSADVAFATSDGTVRWEQYAGGDTDRHNEIDFRALYGEQTAAAAYALTRFQSDRAQPAELCFGSDDTLTVWLNGRRVHQAETYRSVAWDQDIVPIELVEGTNTLLVKVGQDLGAWQLRARITGPAGAAIEGVRDGFDDFEAYAAGRSAPARVVRRPDPLAWSLTSPLSTEQAAPLAQQILSANNGENWPPVVNGAQLLSAAELTLPDGLVTLHEHWPDVHNASILAATRVTVDVATPVEFVVGSDDGITLWLNGDPILRDDRPSVFVADEHRVRATLTPGENRLLARIDQGGGEWMFRVVLWDLSSTPPRLLQPTNTEH